MRQLPAEEHTYERFEEIYRTLKSTCDLSTIDVVVAEYIESLPLLYFMREDGYSCPALMIPHTNPYPIGILFYFLLIAERSHPGDLVICGSQNAKRAYEHMVGIRANSICTFGIKDSIYHKKDKRRCREALGLPQDRTILVYTGRFMNDKGLGHLLAGFQRLRAADPRHLLVISATHIDPPYYNRLAPRMQGVVLFHRLEKQQTVDLYNAADLFVSGATSIFETYGKSPLEALACGVPVVVPRWDGFPYYVDDRNGGLVDVDYLPTPQDNPYEFARMREDHFADVCRQVLGRAGDMEYQVPEWATYSRTMKVLPELLADMAAYGRTEPPAAPGGIALGRYPGPVRRILAHYGMEETRDLLEKADRIGLLNGDDPGEESLLRDLHHELFAVMDAEKSHA
ncbi:glycosyltransferase family 4 protein [Nocardiopsis sediminis]|uniref:Glycosyltransferase family 4 protein n=1 Tax=Nocardiopsis sediminis TaxID=1778267 RepID=A0ABV8FKN9_9ACTN